MWYVHFLHWPWKLMSFINHSTLYLRCPIVKLKSMCWNALWSKLNSARWTWKRNMRQKKGNFKPDCQKYHHAGLLENELGRQRWDKALKGLENLVESLVELARSCPCFRTWTKNLFYSDLIFPLKSSFIANHWAITSCEFCLPGSTGKAKQRKWKRGSTLWWGTNRTSVGKS